jgi:hypothetical protein
MGEVGATSSAVELTTALRSGALSSRKLLETYLERIARLDRDGVNAVVTVADLPRGPFVMALAIAFEPVGSPVTPTPDLTFPTVGPQPPCP